jgi:FkbM family methyltransferase
LLIDKIKELQKTVGFFLHHLRGMVELRGWRTRDNLVLIATIAVYLLLSPVKLVFSLFGLLFAPANPGSKWKRWFTWLAWLDNLGNRPLLDCIVARSDGLLFRVRGGSEALAPTFKNFEPPVRDAFQPKKGEVVIDVGAYIGSYTLEASKLVGDQGKVVAIEAEPSFFSSLLFNLQLNQADNVIPLNLAAWGKEATLELHTGYASPSLFDLPRELSKSLKVRALPLDKILAESGVDEVDWVKMDVEGAEVEVLRGMEKTMSRSPRLKLVVEVHHNKGRECLSILKERGYEVRWIDSNHFLSSQVIKGEHTTA